MNMTSLFHQFLKQVVALVKDNSGKAVARLKKFLNTSMRWLPDPRGYAQTVIVQRFLVLQPLIASSNRSVLLHYQAYPL
jgi:hypothetical protein